MNNVVIRLSHRKGKGLFADKLFRAGEKIFSVDLSPLPPIEHDSQLTDDEKEHIDYAGRGTYVVSKHPYVYINHSCEPNVFVIHHTIARSTFYAMRDIARGEELTYDYGVNAMDQFEERDDVMVCHCGTKSCRKIIHRNFFRQPIENQRTYFRNLPPSIRRRYRDRFRKPGACPKSFI